MEKEKSILRGILDLFESNGFTVTYFLHYEGSSVSRVALMPDAVKKFIHAHPDEPLCDIETTAASQLISLVENNNFYLLSYKTGWSDYAGTVYMEIEAVPGETSAN